MNQFRLTTRLQTSPRLVRRGSARVVTAVPNPTKEPAPAGAPVPVPWRIVKRSDTGVIEVENCGGAPLHSVRFALAGGGLLGLSLPRSVLPGERLRVVVRGRDAEWSRSAPDAMLVMRWFQSDGTELLWPISL
ncbi:hypothetical protein G7067_01910 [Leucobacter insecticola]|uniref:Uncharacterized protein n=1 Tax=Leucobacter insecticola TaxID=2714934 RepID=A0A6G8FGF6_9MICO|nr:hypothetical protein [Leucobacter insecticola]QIM15444.1 hypothetical protein G7067_01910 [Leucobacter insecticola]